MIFGNDARSSLEAVVMCASLKARSKMDILCLHTHAITEVWRQSLASVGWRLSTVTHVEYSPRVYLKEGRFSSVFTKLRVVGLAQYSKVVMLDSDSLIRSLDVVKFFTRDALAAV